MTTATTRRSTRATSPSTAVRTQVRTQSVPVRCAYLQIQAAYQYGHTMHSYATGTRTLCRYVPYQYEHVMHKYQYVLGKISFTPVKFIMQSNMSLLYHLRVMHYFSQSTNPCTKLDATSKTWCMKMTHDKISNSLMISWPMVILT